MAVAALAACGESRPVVDAFATTDHLAVGAPLCAGTLLSKDFFVVCHDDERLIPSWVGYVLRPEDLAGEQERTDDFRPDPDLPQDRRAELADYSGSDFDRGHMAPAGSFKRSLRAMSETFLLSNVAPQTASLNRGEWRFLEEAVRAGASQARAAWSFTGNLVVDADGEPMAPLRTIGSNQVVVPSHCFKTILYQYDDDSIAASAYILANDDADRVWEAGHVSVDQLERWSGLDFFTGLPDDVEAKVEQASAR